MNPERDTYPVPAFAAYVWLAGDRLMVGLPPGAGHERGHTVALPLAKCEVERSIMGAVPARVAGWATLLDLLKQRERAGRIAPIGERSEPTQYQLDAVLANITRFAAKGRKPAATSLNDLGLED
jgi:hypothetical protein